MNRTISVFLSAVLMLVAIPVWAEPAMVWSQDDGSAINVYYSPDGQRVISITSAGRNVTPNLYSGGDSTWITWVDKSNPVANQLRFVRLSNRGVVREMPSLLLTQNAYIYAPAISVDPSGSRVWLVWVESNGNRENLFASHRDIGGKRTSNWKTPLQITPDGKYSANLPTITSSQFDKIEVNWMRTSPDSSESATAEILASYWLPQAATLQGIQPGKRNVTEKYRSLSLSKKKGTGAYIKQLKSGQVLSVSEQQWKNLVRNKNAITGAIQSGSSASKRVAEDFK